MLVWLRNFPWSYLLLIKIKFFNTSIVVYFVQAFVTKNIYGAGGLIFSQNYVYILNSINPIIQYLLDFQRFFKKVEIYIATKFRTVTQGEANQLILFSI